MDADQATQSHVLKNVLDTYMYIIVPWVDIVLGSHQLVLTLSVLLPFRMRRNRDFFLDLSARSPSFDETFSSSFDDNDPIFFSCSVFF